MVYHYFHYTIDRRKISDFEEYARGWIEDGVLIKDRSYFYHAGETNR